MSASAVAQAFSELQSLPRWCAWREDSVDGRPVKMPYLTHRQPARTDSADWLTFDAAQRLLSLEGFHGSGLGVLLGELPGSDRILFGIDLDTCRDRVTGDIAPWALGTVNQFGTLAEISPSGTGIKIFGILAQGQDKFTNAVQVDPVSGFRTVTQFGRQFKKESSGHAEGFEIYSGQRYFTTTGNILPGFNRLKVFDSAESLLEVIGYVGPLFVLGDVGHKVAKAAQRGSHESGTRLHNAFNLLNPISGSDRSQSAYQFRITNALAISNVYQQSDQGAGIVFSYEEVEEIVTSWPLTKGRFSTSSGVPNRNNIRGLQSEWRKVQDQAERNANVIRSSVLDAIEDEEVRARVEELACLCLRDASAQWQGVRDLVLARRDEVGRMRIGVDVPRLEDPDQILHAAQPFLSGVVRYNLRKSQTELVACPPWEEIGVGRFPRFWEDFETAAFRRFLSRALDVMISPEALDSAVEGVARRVAVDPVAEKLMELPTHDPSSPSKLTLAYQEYFGIAATDSNREYLEAVFPVWWTGMIDRVLNPGCQMDYVLVLEGPERIGKSSALRMIGEWAGPYFNDQLNVHRGIQDRDAAVTLSWTLVHEFAEMIDIIRAEPEAFKAMSSSRGFIGRPAYGRRDEYRPRRGVLSGTTNTTEYHTSYTGMRRLLPIKCRTVNFAGLAQDLDLLFAEALWLYRQNGNRPILIEDEALDQAIMEQASRRLRAEGEMEVEYFMAENPADAYCPFEVTDWLMNQRNTKLEGKKLANVLRNLGWEKWPVLRRESPCRPGEEGRRYVVGGESKQVQWWVRRTQAGDLR